ncbi:MAG: alpha/beta fold hydrolase, partial [Gaiellaceae bacterium]
IQCPTLIVWGKDDMLVPVRDASEFERLIPNARKVVFEDTGHVSMIERPPTFNESLVEFLREGLESPELRREDEEAAEDEKAAEDEAEAAASPISS